MRKLIVFGLAAAFLFSVYSLPVLGPAFEGNHAWAAAPAEEAEEDNTHKYAGEKGFRKGKASQKSVEIVLDGKSMGTMTSEKLSQLDEKQIYTPRGPKVGWRVIDAIQGAGVKEGKSIHFLTPQGKKLDLEWADLLRQRDKVVLSYNFNGELILETDTADKAPDRKVGIKGELSDEEEEAVRKQMHQNRQKSLIFLRNVAKIEIDSN